MKTLTDEQAAYVSCILRHGQEAVDSETQRLTQVSKFQGADKDGIAKRIEEMAADKKQMGEILEVLK